MAPLKCCVLGCESTSDTHRLFCMPMNNNLRNLWMSLLVPVNPHLLGLSTGQLMTKRVCQKHFDKTQFSHGSRIRYSYPCLFTEKEFFHGVPLSSEEYNVFTEHNYCSNHEQDDGTEVQEPAVVMGMSDDFRVHLSQEHPYSLPSTSQVAEDQADVSVQEHHHPVSSSLVQPTTARAPVKPGIDGDVQLQEQPFSLPATNPVATVGDDFRVHLSQKHPYSLPSTSQVAEDQADVSVQELHHPVSSSLVQPTTARAPVKPGIDGDVQLQEQPFSLPATNPEATVGVDVSVQEHHHSVSPSVEQPTTVSAKPGIEGLRSSRRPLADISHQLNVEVTRKVCDDPFSKEHPVAEPPVAETDNSTMAHTSKRHTSKDTLAVRQFNAKTRRFIKQTKEIAADSLGQTAAERLKNAHQHSNLDIMQDFEKLNKKAKTFLLMQLRLARKNKMARKFTFDEKLFALALMKQSPKGYKLLENIFALPTKRTLSRLSQNIVFECGINEKVFDHIKHTTKNWDKKKRLCSLVFDEVALSPHLIYNESKDAILGFEEIAGERRQKFADHALVFMARGICSSWRQSIAYYFCAGTVSAADLEKILKEIIPRLANSGLIPLALVCDQGSTFRACFKNLKAKTARLQTPHKKSYDTVHLAGHDLFMFHDPPHLLKSIRNNFLDKDIVSEGKRASWKDILFVYDTDMQGGHTRALPRLTADHVDPKRIKKMKVKMAAQVLSARTAAMLKFTDSAYKRVNMPQDTMEATATLVLFFDELFDSVNGSPGQGKGKLRCAVKPNSAHTEYWRMAILKLKNMEFVDSSSKLAQRAGQPRHVRPPCVEGWITTLKSFLGLTEILFKQYNVEYFYPRFVNQDPLENFFGRIRAMNYRNVNPDSNAFIYSFKSTVLSNMLAPQSTSMNCEEDDGDTLIHLNNLFMSSLESQNQEDSEDGNLNPPSTSAPMSFRQTITKEAATTKRISVQTSAYTVGYICRKMTKKFKCKDCCKTYTTKEHEGIHSYIVHREYKRLKNSNLCYPNSKVLCLYRDCAHIIHNYLNRSCHKYNVKKNIKSIIFRECELSWFGCQTHKTVLKNFFTSLVIRLQTHNWCKIINRILNGKIEEKYVLKMQTFQQTAYKKYKAYRLRQKATKENK